MGEPAIDAPRAVDQLAWWVQHGEELRMENERLRAILDDHCCDDETCACQDPALNNGADDA